MKAIEPRIALNQTKLLVQFGSQNCLELGCPEITGHKLTRPVLENGHNLVYKNSNIMRLVAKCPQDTDLQNWYFDKNPEIKRTRSNC